MDPDHTTTQTDTLHEEGELVFRLEIAAEPHFVSTARLFAATVARQYSYPEDQVQDVKVAISEACSNAIKAHRQAGLTAPIELVIRSSLEGGLTYEVVDTGDGFEFDADDSNLPDGDPASLVDGGIGLTLIGALFPGFEVDSAPDEGTVLRFSLKSPASS